MIDKDCNLVFVRFPKNGRYDKELEYWIEANTKIFRYKLECTETNTIMVDPRYFVSGAWLLPEDAVVFKLKFGFRVIL